MQDGSDDGTRWRAFKEDLRLQVTPLLMPPARATPINVVTWYIAWTRAGATSSHRRPCHYYIQLLLAGIWFLRSLCHRLLFLALALACDFVLVFFPAFLLTILLAFFKAFLYFFIFLGAIFHVLVLHFVLIPRFVFRLRLLDIYTFVYFTELAKELCFELLWIERTRHGHSIVLLIVSNLHNLLSS